VVDDDGSTVAEGKDLAALQRELAPKVRATLSTDEFTRTGARTWEFGTLPGTVEQERAGHRVTVYPALVDEGATVGVRVFETGAEQHDAMWAGTRRLLLLGVASPVALVNARLSNEAKLALSRNPYRNAADLLDDCLAAAVDSLVAQAGGPARDADGFARLRDGVRAALADRLLDVVGRVRDVLAAAHALTARLAPLTGPAADDMRDQLSRLVYRGFVSATGWEHLADLPRYLRAVDRRLDKLTENPARDRDRMLAVQEIEREYRDLPARLRDGPAGRDVRWAVEELRVNYFAQALGTAYPVSDKRIFRMIDQLG